jgi:hypothetical protein
MLVQDGEIKLVWPPEAVRHLEQRGFALSLPVAHRAFRFSGHFASRCVKSEIVPEIGAFLAKGAAHRLSSDERNLSDADTKWMGRRLTGVAYSSCLQS